MAKRKNTTIQVEVKPPIAATVQPAAKPATIIASPAFSPPWSVATKSIVAVVSLVLTALVIWRFQSLLAPLVIALILAYLLNPVIHLVERQLHLKRLIAVLLVYVLLVIALLGGITALGFVVADQVHRLSEDLPRLFERIPALLQAWLVYLRAKPVTIGPYTLDFMSTLSRLDWSSFTQEATNLVRTIFSSGGSLAGQLAQATLDVITLIFLIFVVSIYIARDFPRLGDAIRNIAQAPGYRQDADHLIEAFGQIWNSYLRGQVILCLIMGVVVGLVLAALGVNNALGLGLLWGALEFLPIIGPIVGAVASVLVAFFQASNYLGLSSFYFALLVLIVMTLLQQLEHNLLVPAVVGGALDLPPLVVMISVLMGASLAGVLGAVLAAPVMASLKLLGAYAWRKMLDLPPFPDPPAPPPPRIKRKATNWREWAQDWLANLQVHHE